MLNCVHLFSRVTCLSIFVYYLLLQFVQVTQRMVKAGINIVGMRLTALLGNIST
jgi:hypothetical protein